MSQTHTLTITGEGDARDYELTCPGPDIHCQGYVACEHPDCANLTAADYCARQDGYGIATIHGVAHLEVAHDDADGPFWGASNGECSLVDAPDIDIAAADFAADHDLPVGEHLVHVHHTEDGTEVRLGDAR